MTPRNIFLTLPLYIYTCEVKKITSTTPHGYDDDDSIQMDVKERRGGGAGEMVAR